MTVFCVVSGFGQESDLDRLAKRVEGFTTNYLDSLQNVRCRVEGIDARGVKFQGTLALMGRVASFQAFPNNGAFSFTRSPTWRSSGSGSSQGVKVGNSQYSFQVDMQEKNEGYVLRDLVVQLDNVTRENLQKDPVFFSFSATDAMSIFAPIRVFDVSSYDIVSKKDGIQVSIRTGEGTIDSQIVEAKFPPEHPYGHESAMVVFGKHGEVQHYELVDRPTSSVVVTYIVDVKYANDQLHSSSWFPSEFRFRSKTLNSGETSTDSPEIWVKLSNIELNKNSTSEFTLSHYGIPEPEGTTMRGYPIPYWLVGIVAGAGFLALGIYLRRRADLA
ncbi:MAG: hypothetical protein MUC43_15385 [Pirellula sp.]|nr:hypothetical protein [Pirellula sp.]